MLSFICKRCNKKNSISVNHELICEICKEDLDLLHEQLEINQKRIKKLREHKKSVESELINKTSKKDQQILFETLKRIKHNLDIEYKTHEGINKAMNNKNIF